MEKRTSSNRARVYDIKNAGPRSRFTVRGKTGPVVVHNCQSLAGEICKESIKRCIDGGYPPVGQVHDELILCVPDSEVEKAKEVLRHSMEDPLPWWPEIKLACEVGVGKSWSDCK